MKNSSFIILFFWIFSIPLIAQTPEWAHTFGHIDSNGKDAHIKLDQEENVYLAGNFLYTLNLSDSDIELNGISAVDVFLYKKSPSGELLWVRIFGGIDTDHLHDMSIDHDGNIYIVGQFRYSMALGSGGNSFSITSHGKRDGFIVKYSPNGDLLGAHALGGTMIDDLTTVSFDADNNIILAGNFTGEVDFDLSENTHIEECSGLTLIKYTPDFELIAVETFSSVGAFITNIEVTTDDEILFGGYFRQHLMHNSGEGIPDCSASYSCGFIMKLSNTFEFDWLMSISGNAHQRVRDIKITKLGYIYVAGEFSKTANFLSNDQTHTFESNAGSSDIYFAKLSLDGNIEWIKTMGGPGTDLAAGIALDGYSNIILAGSHSQTMDFDPGSGTAEYTAEGNSASYVSIYNPEGAYINTFTFNNADGNAARGMAVNSNDDIYLTGWFNYSMNFDPSQPGFEFNYQWQTGYIMKLSAVIVGMDELQQEPRFSIYPNPAQDEVHINAANIQNIEIYNIHGKRVLSKAAMALEDRHTIGVSHLPAGTYILSLTANDGFVGSEKFVIIR